MSEPTRTEEFANVPANLADVLRIVAAYWSFNANEQSELAARGIDSLQWPDLFRLHHLNCLEAFAAEHVRQRLESDDFSMNPPAQNDALDRCRVTANRLLSGESPWRPRQATVWQRSLDAQEQQGPPTKGELSNPSLTHLGCLEVLRLNEQQKPHAVAFVPFGVLRGVSMSNPRYFRVARLSFNDGRADETVYLPLVYAMTWRSPSEFLREGRMTFFLDYPSGDGLVAKYGLGVGQQDFALDTSEGRTMFGHASVAQVAFS